MQGKVEICGVNTSKLKVLSQQEMDALLRRSKDGDEEARQELIEGNLRLVLSVIQRFEKRGESPDDLFQVGCIGLIKAVDNFNPELEVEFSTYAVPTVIERRKISGGTYDTQTGTRNGTETNGEKFRTGGSGGGHPRDDCGNAVRRMVR